MAKVVLSVLLVLCTVGLSSCEGLLDDCRICRISVYENGVLINTLQEAEYCGSDLVTILNTPPETDGAITTRWECD